MRKASLGILVSGTGTNMYSIAKKCLSGELPAVVSVVISSRENAPALEKARSLGIPSYVVRKKDFQSQTEYEDKMIAILKAHNVDLVVLAGFLNILSPYFIDAFRWKIINVHPSLIPAFCGPGYYGMKVHEAVIQYGVKITGVTVHFVDESVDGGPIILQRPVEVDDDDTPETLAEKVKQVEHEVLPEAIKLIVENELRIVGRKVLIRREDDA
ncbi:phosphoribosylglycinamide formyltransferase [Pseudothermotoga hypogea DSM 11164 = NBRC 106472]|uniref:Phosphoribosylglycinamide formyltransferase n=2 Tax=Pseudothermotoga hypogea TaxID=57487 RepID=A0A0X1KSC7_9THEM|nr:MULTISPECIES: phosphoribosylglycinamide formyltransferase [Pseudothermotoga]AJC74225.1 phosphoribosylglycinamide formyltransferase [Pseudothermotoga hypogea DSM 11164 = NBRC 106472]MDI6862609.1 phosphoribosylglycinamide formyltransferase [Pseudothermotoga sp.]